MRFVSLREVCNADVVTADCGLTHLTNDSIRQRLLGLNPGLEEADVGSMEFGEITEYGSYSLLSIFPDCAAHHPHPLCSVLSSW